MPENKYANKIVLGDGTVLIDLTKDDIEESAVLAGRTFHGRDGAPKTGTCPFDVDTSEITTLPSEVLIGKQFGAGGAAKTGTMPNNGAQNEEITAKTQKVMIKQGYHDGSGGVAIAAAEQAKIIPNNIREGVTVLGVEGTMSGSEGVKAQAKSVTPSFTQQDVTPDSGFTHLSGVTVQPIPVTYSDNTAGGQTVTIGAA